MLQHYLKEFKSTKTWTHKKWSDQRELERQRFLEKGFPSIKDEAWRYIARSPFLRQPFRIGTAQTVDTIESIQRLLSQPKQPNTLRFISLNGKFYLPSDSILPTGLRVKPITHMMQHDPEKLLETRWHKSMQLGHSFNALNTMFAEEGLSITIADDCVIEPMIEIWYVSQQAGENKEPSMFCTRHHIEIGKNSSAQFLECTLSLKENSQIAPSMVCNNTFTTMHLHSDSKVRWAQSIEIPDHHSYLGQLAVHQEQSSQFHSESLVLGGGLVRNTFSVDLCEPEATCDLRGLTGVKRDNLVDQQIFVEHAADHTKSDIHYRAIADDRARASFGGDITAQPHIHKMASHQGNYNLLLSSQAEIDTRPRLALWSDDIECTHGATVGTLDENALFYLQSRGLSASIARVILIQAFGQAILDLMPTLLKAKGPLSDTFRQFMESNTTF